MKESAYADFIKKYFPGDYKYYEEHTQKVPRTMYEPEMCYLTFVNDKLVKKEKRRGLPWW